MNKRNITIRKTETRPASSMKNDLKVGETD